MLQVAQDEPGQGASGLGIQAGQDVAVRVHGDGDVGVAEALADHLGRDAGGQRRGRVAVTHVVQSDARPAGRPGELLEPLGEPLGVQRPAVRPGEHKTRVTPPRPHGKALLGLTGTVLAQGRHRSRVEGQGPPTLGRLGLRDMDLIVHDDAGPARGDAAGLQGHVGPSEAGDLPRPMPVVANSSQAA